MAPSISHGAVTRSRRRAKLSPCLIGVEACGTAHYWARMLAAMRHEVRLIPPSYVKGEGLSEARQK
jgi:transposase